MTESLNIKNITKVFHHETVLNGINLKILAGEIHVLLGNSGEGKSTLLKCINLLLKPDGGSLAMDDLLLDFTTTKKPSKKTIKAFQHKIGMVFQQHALWPHLSVLKNLTLAPVKTGLLSKEAAIDKAQNLLKRFNLSEKVNASPQSLSGGQQQRISIARSLMLEPKFMLFDEPTSALDPKMTQEVMHIIQELKNNGMGILISTHELTFAREIADKVHFLSAGTILESGSPSILEKPNTDELKHFIKPVQKYKEN